MKQDYTYIEELIERFFDGETTNKEEQTLYDFFSREDEIPEHLQEYKSVFGYFKTGIVDETGKEANTHQLPMQPKKKSWIIWLNVAAALLILVSLRLYFTMQPKESDPFEGSYIIRNGVKITDLDEIRPELEKTLSMALLQREEAERMIWQLNEEDQLYRNVEWEIEQQHCEILNSFTDEYAREKVKKILNIDCN